MELTSAGRRRALLVDPRPGRWLWLETAVPELDVEVSSDFAVARESLLHHPPDLLITNLRLGAYNGLHLVYLAQADRRTRVIVYGTMVDLPLIREAQQIGAFYEAPDRMLLTLRSFLDAPLPARDRRSPREFDRRREHRGGRRAADAAHVPA